LAKIEIRGLSFSYSSHKILDDINMAVEDSEILSLIGPNGSGKTTLIKCIDSILRPRGSIFLDGRDIESLTRQEIARTIGYVPQSSSSPLSKTVFDTVLMGRRPRISWQVSDADLDKVSGVREFLHLEDLVVRDMVHEEKISAIMAIHDLNLASRFSDRLAMLVKGKTYAQIPPELLLSVDNMAHVFGIEAVVMKVSGRPYVVPIRSFNGASNAKDADSIE